MIFLEIFNRQIQKKESPYSYICLQLGSLTCRRMINFFKSFHILFTPNLAISSCGWSPLWLYYKIWRKKKTLLRTCKNVGTKQTLVKAWPIFVSTLQFITFIIGWEGFCMNQHLHWYLIYKSKRGVCLCGQKLGSAWKILPITARSLWS